MKKINLSKVRGLKKGWGKLPKDIRRSYKLIGFLFILYLAVIIINNDSKTAMLLAMTSFAFAVFNILFYMIHLTDAPYIRFFIAIAASLIVSLIVNYDIYWEIPQENMFNFLRAGKLENILAALAFILAIVENVLESIINVNAEEYH